MSLVRKGPDLGSGWQLEAVLPEKGLVGREWSHRNGKRFLNKMAMSMDCCIVISKCRNASGTREVIGSPEPAQKLGENPGTVKAVGFQGGVTVAGLGLSSCTFSLPRCLGWIVALCVGLHRAGCSLARENSHSAIRAEDGNMCRWAGDLPPQSHPEGHACLGLSPECYLGALPWRSVVGALHLQASGLFWLSADNPKEGGVSTLRKTSKTSEGCMCY